MAKGSELGGCLNCYAARLNARNLPNLKSPITGEPFARILDSGPRWTGRVEVIESMLNLPLKWRQPQRIFVNSQSDLFHEDLPFEAIDRVMAVMGAAPWHTFKVLTKRPEVAVRYYASRTQGWAEQHSREGIRVGMESLWLGVSAEDQKTADLRIPLLLTLPVAIRFLSYEPALGPIHLDPYFRPHEEGRRIDWVICGGESGPSARAAHPDWFRSVRDQCAAAGVPFFFKQHGAWVAAAQGGAFLRNIGKAATGAVLDGREHTERPPSHHGGSM